MISGKAHSLKTLHHKSSLTSEIAYSQNHSLSEEEEAEESEEAAK